MDKDVIEMMEKFNENLKRAKELKEVSNPEITENAENNIQELTSEQLKLKMRIERVEDSLEEYRKDDDYLGKSEYQRKIAEKEYTDRIEGLKEEESKALENLENAKAEVEKQSSIENEGKSIKEEINKFGTAQNIRMVKDVISDIENQIDQIQISSKKKSSKISVKMEETDMKLSQIERARDMLYKEPSWNQAKYDEYTKEIDSLKNELGLLEQMQQQNEDKRDKKIEDLVGTKTKFENFLKQLEYIFYGKDILDMQKEESETSKIEKSQEEPAKTEGDKEENTAEEQSKSEEEQKDTTKPEENNAKEIEQPVTASEKIEETEQPTTRYGVTEQEQAKEDEKSETIEEQLKEKFTNGNAKRAKIIISAKNDEILVNGKPITNMGIAKSYADRKGTFKKLNINAEIRNTIGKSFILKRIFVDPIIVARTKAKIDPTIVQLINRQENEEESTKIGEKIGLSIADYINSIRTKEELPVDLTYDLKESKFDNENLMSVENQMQKYARYADQITGVQVEGLKKKISILERLTSRFETSGLIEGQTMAEQMEQEYQNTERNIDEENRFKDELKVDATKSQEGKGELAQSPAENENVVTTSTKTKPEDGIEL